LAAAAESLKRMRRGEGGKVEQGGVLVLCVVPGTRHVGGVDTLSWIGQVGKPTPSIWKQQAAMRLLVRSDEYHGGVLK